MKIRYNYIEALAEKVRTSSGVKKSIPVPLPEILKVNEILLKKSELDENVSGLSFVENGIKVIAVKESDLPSRARFTIAHELGHLLLHHEHKLHINHGSIVYFRNLDSSQGEKWREIEANHFAASLLMPREMLIESLKKKASSGHVGDKLIEILAKKFEVSNEAMAIRLSVLERHF